MKWLREMYNIEVSVAIVTITVVILNCHGIYGQPGQTHSLAKDVNLCDLRQSLVLRGLLKKTHPETQKYLVRENFFHSGEKYPANI